MTLVGAVSILLTAFLFFLLKKNIAWIVSLFHDLLPCDLYLACKAYIPDFLALVPLLSFFCLFVFFSTPLFYSKVPSMDRHRICSVLSPDNSSHRFLIHSLRSVRVRIRTFLLDLIFRVPHFRNCQRRKQSAKNGHCRTQEISNFRFFIPTKNQCNKAKRRPGHEFIDSVSLHFFLRGLISNLSVQTKFYSSPRRLKVSRNFGYFRGVLL